LLPNIFDLNSSAAIGENDHFYCTSTFWRDLLLQKPAYAGKAIHVMPHLLNSDV